MLGRVTRRAADQQRQPPETHPAPQAPTRGEAPARGKWGRDSPMLGGVTGGVIPPGENTVRPRMRTPSASEAAS